MEGSSNKAPPILIHGASQLHVPATLPTEEGALVITGGFVGVKTVLDIL
jgi:hypothetical protein